MEALKNFVSSVKSRWEVARNSARKGSSGTGVISLVVGLAIAIGFGLIFLSQFQTAVGNSSAAYQPIGDIITQIQNNVVWVGLIVLAGLGGMAYALGRQMGIIG